MRPIRAMGPIRGLLAAVLGIPLLVLAATSGPAFGMQSHTMRLGQNATHERSQRDGRGEGRAEEASIEIRNQALLLDDGTVLLTVDYSCLPGPGGNTVGKIVTSVDQGGHMGSGSTSTATCDGGSHTANIDNGPGPYSEGPAMAGANVINSAGDGAAEGAPITVRAHEASIEIRNQALLLADGTVVVTVDYSCVPGPGDNTVGKIVTSVDQGGSMGSGNTSSATCDDRSHIASIQNEPGPFREGPAMAGANVINSAGDGANEGAPITIK